MMCVLGGITSGTQWTSSSSPHISLILNPGSFCAILWTTIGSGCSTPSTHPSGTWLMGWWVRHPSKRSFGKLFPNSIGVNSASADQVDTPWLVSSFLFKGMTSPWGVANRNSQLQWATCKLLLASFISYKGTPFVTWHITSYSTSLHQSFTFLFPWNVSAFFSTVSPGISWTASSYFIVVLLSVRFAVQLVLDFSIGFFEVC